MQLKSRDKQKNLRPTKGLLVINYKSMTKLGVREFLKLKFYREFKFSQIIPILQMSSFFLIL